jgi:predicted nucleic acid-binding protein
VYLVDTDVISNARKHARANPGVRQFFRDAARQGTPLFLSAVTIGELRQGVEMVHHRGDLAQATRLARWLTTVTREYADAILPFDGEIAQIWGRLRVPHAENPLDKQIAATALAYGLTVVTGNVAHYEPTGVAVLNPFM